LDELIAEVAADSAIEASARECSVTFYPPAAPILLEGDAELLRRAVENVLRNAIRYAPPQTAVDVNIENKGERLCIRIRDRGPGVPPEGLQHIFRPFYRIDADRTRMSGGVGLGLAIAQRAVALHHGSIRAANAEPGLLVEIELPTHAAELALTQHAYIGEDARGLQSRQ
jgi:two-component system sensor histidine kinase CpxA